MIRICAADAATLCGVQAATLRRWAREGHVTRHRDGSYDYDTLIAWRDHRSIDALAARAGLKLSDVRPTLHAV